VRGAKWATDNKPLALLNGNINGAPGARSVPRNLSQSEAHQDGARDHSTDWGFLAPILLCSKEVYTPGCQWHPNRRGFLLVWVVWMEVTCCSGRPARTVRSFVLFPRLQTAGPGETE